MLEKISKFISDSLKWIAIFIGVILFVAISIVLYTMEWHMVDQPFFGGLFNITFWNIQVYFFLAPAALLLYFAAFAYWVHFKWGMMTPFHGLWYAIQSQSEVVFVSDLKLNFALISESAAKLVFDKARYNSIAADTSSAWTRFRMWMSPVDQAVHIAKYLQGSWDSKPMTNIGSIPASILLDAYGWTKAVSPQRVAISKVVDEWNDIHADDQIHSLSKAWQYMDSGKLLKPDSVDLYVKIPWVRIDNAYPKKRYEAERGGFIRQIALNIVNGMYSKGLNMTTAGIVVFIACFVFSCIMFFFKYSAHVPVK